MGTKMGPNYANLFLSYVEEQIFNQFSSTVRPRQDFSAAARFF